MLTGVHKRVVDKKSDVENTLKQQGAAKYACIYCIVYNYYKQSVFSEKKNNHKIEM